MSNKSLLGVIIVLLLGIFTVMIVQMNEQTPEEEISQSVSNAIDTMSNQIDARLETSQKQ